ncbi:MAG TPA: alanine racemase, partial [Ramlibacter sp.]|nr:alanine racemase [Ramlibacter sp.]
MQVLDVDAASAGVSSAAVGRPAQAVIDLGALRGNYLRAKGLHRGRLAAVLKANAYGHGSVRCARALADVADAFAVAFVQEALVLREAGIRAPVLVLEGAFGAGELELAARHVLWLVVHCAEQVRMLEARSQGPVRLHVWLKIDSGMHRAGVAPADVKDLWRRLAGCDKVASVTLMTHFACADEASSETTRRQISVFEEATAGIPGPRSACNS